MKPYKICCVTYKELDTLVKEAIKQLDDEEILIQIVEGLREEIVEKIDEKILEGAEVIIAGGANSRIAKDFCDLPVLDYMVSQLDFLNAIDKGFALGEKPAIVTYKSPMSQELYQYLEKKGLLVENIIYENTEELEEKILNNNIDVVIGAAHPIEIARKLNIKDVLIYPGCNAIRETILRAKNLAKEIRRSKEKAKFVQIMMNYSTNGFIIVNNEGKIIEFNKSAREILDKDKMNIKGSYIWEVLPECEVDKFIESSSLEESKIIKIGDKKILQNWIRIQDNVREYMGAVGILSNVSDIHKMQIEYRERERIERGEKGFRAKNNINDIIGKSYSIKKCIEEAIYFASSDSNVLVYGETGVGKEIFAQSIHNNSMRKNEAFIAINCAALSENLLEAELFGYDEGAFTGGRKGGKKGLFELAEDGTIFLDEIGEISQALQTKLLRVLQEKEIMHIGGDRVIPVNARVISATNKNLEEMSDEIFRRDLLYRLNVLELKIPPLRERNKDIIELFEFFFRQKSNIENYDFQLTSEIKNIILNYSWPGNIRELQNVCERFSLFVNKDIRSTPNQMKRCIVKAIGEERLFKDVVKKYEFTNKNIPIELIEEIGNVFSYSKKQIGDKLGISRSTIWRMAKKQNK